jgi:hypothetical protein
MTHGENNRNVGWVCETNSAKRPGMQKDLSLRLHE